ncbi:DEAD/DEAH box helicase [Calditrichota bacterium LG25]
MKFDLELLQKETGITVFNKGKNYFKTKRVKVITATKDRVESYVYGMHEYKVIIQQKDGAFYVECNCPYFVTNERVCKHIVATIFEYERLREEQITVIDVASSWQTLIPPKDSDIKKKSRNRVAFVFNFFPTSWQIKPVLRYIKKDGTLGREINFSLQYFSAYDFETNPDELMALGFLSGLTRISNSIGFQYGSEYGQILHYLRDSYLLYSFNSWENIPVTFLEESFDLHFTIEKQEDQYVFKLFLKTANGDQKIMVNDQFLLLSSERIYFFYDMKIWPVKQKISARLLLPFCNANDGLIIPEKEMPQFLKTVYPQFLEANADTELPDSIQLTVMNSLVKKALYLSEEEGNLHISVSFFYGGQQEDIQPIKVEVLPFKKHTMLIQKNQYVLIARQEEVENFYLNILAEHQLVRQENQFILAKKVDALEWLFETLPELAKKGFEIYGEDKLDKLKVRRAAARLITQVSSGTDWFDLNVEIDFDGLRMSYQEVVKALRKNKNFIRLNDGSAAKIDQETLNKIGLIKTFGSRSKQNGTVRLSKTQALLIDEILNDSAQAEADQAFKDHLQKLKSFKTIRPVELPKNFRGELRPYQKAGLDWLVFLNEYGLGGCLADDMGLGKTIQALALLQLQKEKLKKNLVSLIVAPTSVLTNWQNEAARFTPDLKVYLHTGQERKKNVRHFEQFDLIITSYALLWRDFDLLKEVSFHYIILDESQKIKNPLSVTARAAYRLRASHRLVMTGTPIENNLAELWSQFQFINPGMLGSLEAFSKHFGKAIEKQGDQEKAEQLRRLIYPFILRRTKDMVAKELPPKVENILFCDMGEQQQKAYEKWRDYYRALILKTINEKGLNRSKMKVLEGLTRLRQLAIHPAMVENNHKSNSGKFDALHDILEEVIKENHKVLLFSQFVKALTLVRQGLDQRSIPYLYLDGSTKNRQKLVDKFQNNSKIKIFLISLKAGGLGLNLTAADYVIHLDPWWNPAVEAQAMDRAHRIGQNKKVFVYKMITRGSVEEKILTLQQRKKNLAEQLITTDAAFFKNLEKDDIVQLFS